MKDQSLSGFQQCCSEFDEISTASLFAVCLLKILQPNLSSNRVVQQTAPRCTAAPINLTINVCVYSHIIMSMVNKGTISQGVLLAPVVYFMFETDWGFVLLFFSRETFFSQSSRGRGMPLYLILARDLDSGLPYSPVLFSWCSFFMSFQPQLPVQIQK